MKKILHIEGSPRKVRSSSIKVAQYFISSYMSSKSNIEVETIDLWKYKLPEFDKYHANAKYTVMNGNNPTDKEKKAWNEVVDVIKKFKSADIYVFSLPMWNFGVPYKVKQFIDIVTQPGYTFSVSEKGYEGKMNGKKAIAIYSRGGSYEKGHLMDMQRGYLEMWLKFIGFQDIHTILVEPMMSSAEKKQEIMNEKFREVELIIENL